MYPKLYNNLIYKSISYYNNFYFMNYKFLILPLYNLYRLYWYY